MKKILIMGGTIFVSKYLATYFIAKGDDVYVYNRNTHKQPEKARLIVGDRNNIGDSLKQYDFDLVIAVNTYTGDDMKELLSSLSTIKDIVFISSSAVYPETLPQPFKEEQLVGDNSIWGDYGSNKIEAEQVLLSKVPNAYIIRPPYLYGKMQNLYREAFVFDCALADRKFYLPQDGGMKLQFFHVKDLCRLMEVIIKEKPEEHILNVGNVEAVSIKEWVTKCYESIGKIPNFVNVYEEIEQRNYFSFYNYEYYLDVSRQNKIYPETISLEDGLRDSVKWYLEHRTEVNKKPYFEYINKNLVKDQFEKSLL